MGTIENYHDTAGIDAPLGFGGQDTWESFIDPAHLFTSSKKDKKARKANRRLDAQNAAVTRDQWEHFKQFYRPIEQEALRKAQQTDFTQEGDEAGATARAGAGASKGSLARSLSRSGATLTAEEKGAVDRRHSSSLTKSVARAENTTRRGLSDSRTNLLAGLVGIGRGVSRTATSGMNSAADMAAARETERQRAEDSRRNTGIAAGATILGAVIGGI